MVALRNSIAADKHQSNMRIKKTSLNFGRRSHRLQKASARKKLGVELFCKCIYFRKYFSLSLSLSLPLSPSAYLEALPLRFFISLEILRFVSWARNKDLSTVTKSHACFRNVFIVSFFSVCNSSYLLTALTLISIFVDSLEILVLESLLFFFYFRWQSKSFVGSSLRLAKLAIEFCRQFQRADVSGL